MDAGLPPPWMADFQIWAVFAMLAVVLVLYVTERLPMEITSIGAIVVLILFFHLVPVVGADGGNRLDVTRLLAGFSNPAVLTVLGLLVIGQGLVHTGVLERGALALLSLSRGRAALSVAVVLLAVTVISAVMNNVPVVVIFIPILQSLAERMKASPSRVMMGLSFTAALGGSMTLVGSGSNLLVSSELAALGQRPLGFFEMTLPATLLAGVGLVYVLLAMPRLLVDRASLAERLAARTGQYFMAQIPVSAGSPVDGTEAVGGVLKELPSVRLRMVVREQRVFRPPFHRFRIRPGDLVVVAGSRRALTDIQGKRPGLLRPPGFHDHAPPEAIDEILRDEDRALAEVMVAPGSSLIRRRIGRSGFQARSRCAVLGIRRRGVVFRSRLSQIFMEAGDVLLVQGRAEDVERLRDDPDVVLMSGSSEHLPHRRGVLRSLAVFLTFVVGAATGAVPVVALAIGGAAALVALGVLNVTRAARALDSRIVTVIPATLAFGVAMQETGGAALIAQGLTGLLDGAGPASVLSGFFLITALLSNVIGSNATAVLFTPIAIGLAGELGGSLHLYAITVLLAANCAFATPTGYQTSLLVMGPGHYRYMDFVRAGAPLVLLLWLTFTIYVLWVAI